MKKIKMNCSLVITTYNWKESLKLVVLSAFKQTRLPNEIIIADDGSAKNTRNLIEKLNRESNIPIIHSWQEDKGFRAAKSRNKAIAIAKYKYIILIDGDMLLHKNFILDHIKNARKNYFLQGCRALLTEEKTAQLIHSKNICFTFWDKGIKNKKNTIYNSLFAKLFSYSSNSLKGIKTCNMSFFKSDCIDINGFNEDFIGWGREDSEFAVRLLNNDIKRKNIKFNCIAYHLWHQENQRVNLDCNDMLLSKSINENLTYCQNGIKKYLGG
jgi:glycosyltransferase involved in cell wall biosynthesis